MIDYLSDRQDTLDRILAAHEIHADDSAKVAIGRLAVHLDQPSGVSLALGRVHALSTVRRRQPLYLLPSRPPLFLDREKVLETLSQALTEFRTVDLYAPDGAGKSTLVAALAQDLDPEHFPDGFVFVARPARHQDLLQVLFNSFYEADVPVKITARQAPTYLNGLRALVILDGVGLGPKQIDPILDALQGAAVLISGVERTALGRGDPVSIKGLPRPEAVALFAEFLGRALTPEEQPFVEQICATLNDMPLPISCVALQAARGRTSLDRLLSSLEERKPWAGPGGDPSVGPSLERIVATLDAVDRKLVTLIAAFAGPSASREALRALTELPLADFQERVERLQGMGLLRAVEPASPNLTPRLALPCAYYRAVRTWLVDDEVKLEVASYYVSRLAQGDRLPGVELPGLLGAIEDCAHNDWLDALRILIHAADRSLACLGWWAEWQNVLDLTRRAAQEGGDRNLEAWAMHQLGSLLGALAVFPSGPITPVGRAARSADEEAMSQRALHLLRTALNMRQASGDEAGVALTDRNLRILEQLLPAPAEPPAPAPQKEEAPAKSKEPEPPPPPSKRARLKRVLAALLVLALLAAGVLGAWFVWGNVRDDGAATGPIVSWEFGDAWNALDNETWTQEIVIVVEDDGGEYQYFADGVPVDEVFEVTLPLCEGAQGIIQVKSDDGQIAQVEYAFESPFCR